MNKVKVTAATAGLVAALGLSYTSSAYADDVDATVDANASESTSNASQNTVTQADVDTAKASVESANQAVSTQEQVVKEAASAADKAQTAYDEASQATTAAKELADQATPEHIADAKADVTTAQNQVSQA